MPKLLLPLQHQGIMLVTNTSVQRSGMGKMQPPSATQSVSAQTAAVPAPPPPTVQTVDTSSVLGRVLIESACSVDRVEEALSKLLPILPKIQYFRFNPGIFKEL
ncbi:hypothetical protein COLO4_18537 [Corchorus olitorius]|uniref:Uncharacterized protein n=1 Tax=Corchorus olitorius TaxID=93759 RepID=A0A1R3J8T7_9ROSI|nr:hypothetical protein COLO4_18537 [Corchorus olitorius]